MCRRYHLSMHVDWEMKMVHSVPNLCGELHPALRGQLTAQFPDLWSLRLMVTSNTLFMAVRRQNKLQKDKTVSVINILNGHDCIENLTYYC